MRLPQEIAEASTAHPMGRSLATVGGSEEGPPIGAATGLPFESQGLWYTVERRDGHVFHKASATAVRTGACSPKFRPRSASPSARGHRGVNFLTERDGFLFQSPIAWFTQQKHWGISPGSGE